MEKTEAKNALSSEKEAIKDPKFMQFEFCAYTLKRLVAKIKPDSYKNRLKSFNL